MPGLKRLAQLGVTAVAATALIGGLSANAQAATGNLFYTTADGAQHVITDPVDFVCYSLEDGGAVFANNQTDENAFFYQDSNCLVSVVVGAKVPSKQSSVIIPSAHSVLVANAPTPAQARPRAHA
ncbi:hypothetical protein ACFP1Z_00325 [Streptomyces gamaensis]|uniref:YHS domain-containing protein n=1 Tax=Streptomyces gamaensis TaxID=1763542 RepID=A0ABW0YPZ5_9ACTN